MRAWHYDGAVSSSQPLSAWTGSHDSQGSEGCGVLVQGVRDTADPMASRQQGFQQLTAHVTGRSCDQD